MSVPDWLTPLLDAIRDADTPLYRLRVLDDGRAPRQSAVLVLFGEGSDGPDVLLLRRADGLRDHAGQPAFPGGRLDPPDADLTATALREAQEETGLDPAGVEVLATLPELVVPPSASLVTPVLGWWRTDSPVGVVDPGEVASVQRVPIATLVDPANRLRVRGPSGYEGPAFRVGDMVVWGFTAMVLDRLLALGGWERPWPDSAVEPLPGTRRSGPVRDEPVVG